MAVGACSGIQRPQAVETFSETSPIPEDENGLPILKDRQGRRIGDLGDSEFRRIPKSIIEDKGPPPPLDPLLLPLEARAHALRTVLGESARVSEDGRQVIISAEAAGRMAAHLSQDWANIVQLVRGMDSIIRAQHSLVRTLRIRADSAESIAADREVLYQVAKDDLKQCRAEQNPNPWVVGSVGVLGGFLGGALTGAAVQKCPSVGQ